MASDVSNNLVSVVSATSRVGRAAIDCILKSHEPLRVRGVVRTLNSVKALEDFQCDRFESAVGGDAFDESTHEAAFRGASKAFIVAPQLENRDEAVNRLIDGAKRWGCQHVVLIGGVFQEEEKFVFHRQWMASRRHAEAIGLVWTQLECVDFMENLYRNQENVRKHSRLEVVGENTVTSPSVALPDIGAAAAAVLASQGPEHDNRAYRMAGPHLISPSTLADNFSRLLEKSIAVVNVPLEHAKQKALASGQWQRWQLEGFFDWMEKYLLAGRLSVVKSDLPLLGVRPTSLEEWLEAHISSFVEP